MVLGKIRNSFEVPLGLALGLALGELWRLLGVSYE